MAMKGKRLDKPIDDAGPSEQRRMPSLTPKHTIFLSLSGAQSDFTEQLYEDLLRAHHYAFFDRRPDSLPKGEEFVPLIKKAAKQCQVAVLVLSEDFFSRTKWPMMELNEFVKAQESTNPSLKILPLFLGLKLDEFMDEGRRKTWLKGWTKFALGNGEVNLQDWEHALSKVSPINVLQYEGQGHVTFRKEVVDAICRLVPPAVKSDDSWVQSREKLCKPISQRFEETSPSRYGARVVGLHGMLGIGKTTISRVFCNKQLQEFAGRACHVELGGNNSLALQKKVLRELTHASDQILEYRSAEELDDLLNERMCRQRVFLALDNLSVETMGEARKYLEAGFHDGSLVLLTSRSLNVLVRGLDILECDCLSMPGLDEVEARRLFLYQTGRMNDYFDEEIIRRYLKRCQIGFREKDCCIGMDCTTHYHPLTLYSLGSQLRLIDVTMWADSWKLLKGGDLKRQRSFSVLRHEYDALDPEEQHIFLDLALCFRHGSSSEEEKWKWLCLMYKRKGFGMEESVDMLRRSGLIVETGRDGAKFEISALLVDFARADAHKSRFLYFVGNDDSKDEPTELPNVCANLRRVIIWNRGMRNLKVIKVHQLSNVELLQLRSCLELEEIDVTEMTNLRLVEIFRVSLKRTVGVKMLTNLVSITFEDVKFQMTAPVFSSLCDELSSLEMLEVIRFLRCWVPDVENFPPNLSWCLFLHEITFVDICYSSPHETTSFDDAYRCYFLNFVLIASSEFVPHIPVRKGSAAPWFYPMSVRKMNFSNFSDQDGFCRNVSIKGICTLTNLQDLNLSNHVQVYDISGLKSLILLEKLNVSGTSISELPDFEKVNGTLRFLDVSSCWRLTSLIGIANVTSLECVIARQCGTLLKGPNDYSKFEKLDVLDYSGSVSFCTLPKDYGRLVKGILKVERCYGLVEPLLREVRRHVPLEQLYVIFGTSTGSSSRDEDSIQSLSTGMKDCGIVAYSLLKSIFPNSFYGLGWWYLSDFDKAFHTLVCALLEHANCYNKQIPSEYLFEGTIRFGWLTRWWALVVTAPSTFRAVMKSAVLEPWNKTLLHYSLLNVLPWWPLYVDRLGDFDLWARSNNIVRGGNHEWYVEVIMVLLRGCKEKLQEAIELGIELKRSMEGMELVYSILREIDGGRSWAERKGQIYPKLMGLAPLDVYMSLDMFKEFCPISLHSLERGRHS